MIARIRARSRMVLLASLAALGCAHTPTPPAAGVAEPAPTTTLAAAASTPVVAPLSLVPANMARPMLVASFVVSSLDHSLENAVALVHQASPIPIDAAGARELLLAQIGLPSEIARHLDLGAPVAGAAVAGRPGTPPLMAFAMTAKSGPDAQAVLAAAGSVIARRGPALQIQAKTGEKGWFLPMDNVLLVADGEDALTMAGSLALEGAAGARNVAGADLSVTVYPDVLARAMGTTVPAELERVVTALDGQRTATAGDGAAARARPAREVAGYLADAVSVELTMNLDAGRGLGVAVRLVPRPGSKLEILAREVPGAMPDPGLAGGNENPGALIVSAYDKRNLEPLRRIREALAASPGSAASKEASKEVSKKSSAPREGGAAVAGQFLDALLEGLTGGMSSTFRMRPLLSGEIVYAGKAGGGAGVLSAALLRLDKVALGEILVASGVSSEGATFKVASAKPESFGKVRGVHARLTVTAPPSNQKAFAKLIAPGGVDVLLAIVPAEPAGKRLVITFGGEAKARMLAMTTHPGAGVTRPPLLSEALAGAGARSLFAFIDLRDVIRFALALGQNSRERAVGDSLSAPMPVYGGVTGEPTGKKLTVDLIVPPTCFAGMGGLLQAALMMRN